MSALALHGVSVDIGARRILEAVSFTVARGEFVVLVGPNGAGKSTALRAALGLQPIAAGGRIEVSGRALSSLGGVERGRLISYLPQQRDLAWQLRTCDLVALGRYAFGGAPYDRLAANDREIVDAAMVRTGVEPLKQRSVLNLSGGEQARAHLARALAARAPVLVTDEPTTALDPRHQLDALATLRAEADSGVAVVAALHDLEAALQWADRVVVFNHGRVFIDAAPAVALSDSVLAEVFRVQRSERRSFEPA
jgi:iron complex transport system ATP-binding protein